VQKILLINNGYPSETNKQYTAYIKSIKESLELSGQEVDLLVMYADFSNKKLSKIMAYTKYYFKLLFFTHYKSYDYVYINNYPHSFLPLSFRLKFMKNIIIHWHGADIFAEKLHSKILNRLSYIFIPKSCKHIAPSKYFANAVVKTLNLKEEDIFISASGGVDTNIFVPNRKNKKGFHIGFASHVSKEKGFDMFAQMIEQAEILEKTYGIKLFFHYISYGNKKEFYNEKFKNNKNVIIHNLYPKENMSDFYSKIDLLLLLSTRFAESLGLVSLEAMSCDIPVVGTDAFAVQEYIVEGQTGERFEMQNYEEMIKAIEKIIKDYESYTPREFIVQNYSMQSVVDGYKEYFNAK
jgi:glycosyltransferase involved in cell wall biosynthesis